MAPNSQEIFETFLRGDMTLHEAADALVAITIEQKAAGLSPAALALRKPANMTLTSADHSRAKALFAELDRRASAAT